MQRSEDEESRSEDEESRSEDEESRSEDEESSSEDEESSSEDEKNLLINSKKLNKAIHDVKDAIINLELSLSKSDSNRMANELLGLKIEVFSYLQPISLSLIIFLDNKENIKKTINSAEIIKTLYLNMLEKILLLKAKKEQLQNAMKEFDEKQIKIEQQLARALLFKETDSRLCLNKFEEDQPNEYICDLEEIKRSIEENIHQIKDIQRNFVNENEQLCREIEVPFGAFFEEVSEFGQNVEDLRELLIPPTSKQLLPSKIQLRYS